MTCLLVCSTGASVVHYVHSVHACKMYTYVHTVRVLGCTLIYHIRGKSINNRAPAVA